uniref:Uncharacterized protein n=1 Tax=viral metagenome TaxID=1070528 RepID=A0A6C0CH35_9ZZZZ
MNSSKYAFLSHDETRRNATEEKLFGFQIEEGEKALVTALCDAMGEKFRLDRIDRLFDPRDWKKLASPDEVTDLDEWHRTGKELDQLWKAKLEELQVNFLREHGHRIPGHVLPRTLAYEALREEPNSKECQPVTKVLETMGINH